MRPPDGAPRRMLLALPGLAAALLLTLSASDPAPVDRLADVSAHGRRPGVAWAGPDGDPAGLVATWPRAAETARAAGTARPAVTARVAQGDAVTVGLPVAAPGRGPWPRASRYPGRYPVAGLPVDARAHVTAGPGRPATLTVVTAASTPVGDYRILVAPPSPAGRSATAVTVRLVVVRGSVPLGLALRVEGLLEPGRQLPIAVTFTNPNDTAVRIRELLVQLGDVDDAHPQCLADDNYAVTGYRGPRRRLVIPPHGTVSLSALGVPPGRWPQLRMGNPPFDQSACQGARVGVIASAVAEGEPA